MTDTIYMPPYRSMNLAVYTDKLNCYEDMDDLKRSYELGNLNGLEVILAMDDAAQARIPAEMINGVHLYYHIFWVAMMKGDMEWLLSEFDSREQMEEYYSGDTIDGFRNWLRHDMDYAKEVGAKYVVLHVSEVNMEEAYTNEARYSDIEVIDAAIELINSVLDGTDYEFDFLVENLPWKGFGLTDPALTRRMLDGINYPHKGIMFDTGHFMNANPGLKDEAEAIACIHRMLDEHEAAGIPITDWIKGMHLQKSLNAKFLASRPEGPNGLPEGFREKSFYERYAIAHEFMSHFDEHQPFLAEGVAEMIERIRPLYLTEEFAMPDRASYERAITDQRRILGW